MKKNIKIIVAIFSLALISAVGISVHANQSYFGPGSATAAATTTLTFMTPGAATTTLYYDAYAVGITTKVDAAVLLLQLTASSTSTNLNVGVEYAQEGTSGADCTTSPTLCDWYQDAITTRQATTTNPVLIAAPDQYSWTFASSTPGKLAPGASNNKDNRAIKIATPTRYMRVIFTMTGTNGAIWGKIIPIRETK